MNEDERQKRRLEILIERLEGFGCTFTESTDKFVACNVQMPDGEIIEVRHEGLLHSILSDFMGLSVKQKRFDAVVTYKGQYLPNEAL